VLLRCPPRGIYREIGLGIGWERLGIGWERLGRRGAAGTAGSGWDGGERLGTAGNGFVTLLLYD